ncbi:MAG: hypothetical protein J6C33_10060 [Lachnospiraceae bacterium]|nr:hypothetical protein [Lachnospiraceae bacterium]
MEERLQVHFHIAEETKELMIPKISIQTLVENSILHGIGGGRDSIAIEISARLKNGFLYITIQDNGCGIDAAHLEAIKQSFRCASPSERNNIGLSNLYGRLHLLYQDKADLSIETQVDAYTIITLTIPATREAPHVQSSDH